MGRAYQGEWFMRRSWVITSGLLLCAGCMNSVQVGADAAGSGTGGTGGVGGGRTDTGSTTSSSSAGSGGATSSSSSTGDGGATSSSSGTGSGNPCDGVICTMPNAPECESATALRSYDAAGTCADGTCNYAFTDMECAGGCSNGSCVMPPLSTRIFCGTHMSCLRLPSGVECWGYNSHGQLGDNSKIDSHVPVPASALSSDVAIIAPSLGAYSNCAITSAGGVECWGYNAFGQLGNNSQIDSLVPTPVTGLSSGVVDVSIYAYEACAVTTAGSVKCWGEYDGQLGNLVPVDVINVSAAVGVAVRAGGACAVTSTGAVKCWGDNTVGQLGNNTTDSAISGPVDVVGLSSGVVAVTATGFSTCALLGTGAVKCWGWGGSGKLGNNTTGDSPVPVDVVGLSSGVVAIDAGMNHVCALLATGALKCWGSNDVGELGNGSNVYYSTVPADVIGLSSPVVDFSCGADHTCAILANGKVECWGFNGLGQLGDGTTVQSSVPVEVVGF